MSWLVMLGCCAAGGEADSGREGRRDVVTELRITEVVPSNTTGLQDESGAFPDWIEIANPTSERVDLGGYALSEEDGWTDQWVFGNGTRIDPGGYLVVFADGDEEQGSLHTNFKLSSTGEVLTLYAPRSAGSQRIDTVEFPAVPTDNAYARIPEGGSDWQIDATPTPGAPNE